MGNQPSSVISPTTSHKTASSPNKSLDKIVKHLSLSKLHLTKSKKKKTNYYPVPPNAGIPSCPSCPEVEQDQDQYFVLRWDPPAYDGGCPIMGYVIQHLELGLPQLESQDQDDTEAWYSSEPGQITQTECILNNLVPGTTYQFRVVAENLIGYSLPSDVSDAIVFNPHGELDDWFYAPMFTATLDDSYTVMEHEMVTLSVELKGQPYPVVHWYDKNDQELIKVDSKKYKTRSSGFRRTLVITSVELNDAGIIKCIGSNREGQIEFSTLMHVEAPPRIRRVQNAEFLQNPYDVSEKEEHLSTFLEDEYDDLIFQAGELVRLKFVYSGSPKPEISIYHNGELVKDSRVVTEFTDKMITVRIENVLRCDRGEWLAKLDNVLGEDCTSVLVTITDHPNAPGKPEILQLSDNTCILRWDEPQDDGGCAVHNYIVEYFRSEWGVWLKALTSKNPGTKIKDLIPGSKYRFRVKAENLYGVSEPSEESAEILITDAPSSRTNEVLMSTLEESLEEESMEILSHSDFQEEFDDMYTKRPPPRKNRPSPSPKPPRKVQQSSPTDKKLYNREEIIKSAKTSSGDSVKRFLTEAAKGSQDDEGTDDEYEYDFETLQKEYEDEMRALRDQLEESDEFDDDEEVSENEQEKEKEKVENPKEETKEPEEEVEEEEFVWPRKRVFRVEKIPEKIVLNEKFKDYLTMKINVNDKKKTSSIRSLNSSNNDAKSDKTQSRENIRRLLDFDGDERCASPQEEENLEEAVKIQEVRRAIILNEAKLEAERLVRETRKEELRKEAEENELRLEARRRANRKQKSEEELVEELLVVKVDPEKASKMVLMTILIMMIPIYWYYGVIVMLLAFVVLTLLWNKLKRFVLH